MYLTGAFETASTIKGVSLQLAGLTIMQDGEYHTTGFNSEDDYFALNKPVIINSTYSTDSFAITAKTAREISYKYSGAVLHDFYTDVSTSGTGATDLYSYTIPANTLSRNGDKIEAKYIVYNDAGTGTAHVNFAGYDFDGTNIVSGGNEIIITLIRVSSTVCRVHIRINALLFAYYERTSQNFTTTNILKLVGQASVGSLVAKFGYVEYIPAAIN